MQKYKLVLAYDGTHFSGWQVQSNALSIQEVIEAALKKILHIDSISLISAGRTDAGVHARGQVAHFTTCSDLDLTLLLRALNGVLPKDIRVLHAEQVPASFHARYSAVSKEYHYHICLDRTVDPFRRLYVYHCPVPLDRALMCEATTYFIGTHDFTSFANEASKGSAAKNPVRTLYRLDICEEAGGIRLEFEGDGFLYKMVRNITGTLLSVGKGETQPSDIPKLLAMCDRRGVRAAAPAQALFLVKVSYEIASKEGACKTPAMLSICGCEKSHTSTAVSTPALFSDS